MNATPRRTLLCILDGLGLNPVERGNAVAAAETPCLTNLFANYPHSTLTTFGEAVGLPEEQMGNSEVGHLNIGAGRVVEQWLLRISRALQGRYLQDSKEYREWLQGATQGGAVHLIGLFSDGGVHSHSDHLLVLLRRISEEFSGKVYLHLITDGRDTSPQRAHNLIEKLETALKDFPHVQIATVIGRFYAMDRDNRTERTQAAYNAIAKGQAVQAKDPLKYIEYCYQNGQTDEFIEAAAFNYPGIREGDSVLYWNFRADRMRQIVKALSVPGELAWRGTASPFNPRASLCFTDYDPTFALASLFPTLEIRNYLGEVVSLAKLKQLRVAETEKYPHVTYFLNGGKEEPSEGEDRQMVPSPRDVKTYDLKPEMSAAGVTAKVVEGIASGNYHFIAVNFANCDMVGHTGVLEAAVKAVETVDQCLHQVLEVAKKNDWRALIIADHGNAEQLLNYEDGTPHTAHTTYPVPVILFNAEENISIKHGGALCDVAPTVLELMGLEQPIDMTGQSLLVKKEELV